MQNSTRNSTVFLSSTLALFLYCFCCADLPARETHESDWQVLEVGDYGGVAIRLKVLNEASIADFEWLGLELQNNNDIAVEKLSMQLRLESEQFDLVSGELLNSSDLGLTGLALEDWPASAVARHYRDPSNYAAALLSSEWREVKEFEVRATAHLDINIAGMERIRTPPDGHLGDISRRVRQADSCENDRSANSDLSSSTPLTMAC